jgi:hypothetical protein
MPVSLLIEVTEKTSELLPASFFGSGKAARADQSLLLAVTLLVLVEPSSMRVIVAEPPVCIVRELSLSEIEQPASLMRRGRCGVSFEFEEGGAASVVCGDGDGREGGSSLAAGCGGPG